MLIEGMLLPSGNDAAYVLAAAAGRKIAKDPLLDGKRAVDVFMKQMKSYGTSIGLCGTNFTVPDGYAGNEHYICLRRQNRNNLNIYGINFLKLHVPGVLLLKEEQAIEQESVA